MSKLDPLLAAELEPDPAGPSPAPELNRRVRVTVRFDGEPAALEAAGLVIERVSGPFASGSITLGELQALADLDEVAYVEAPRRMRPRLDQSVPEIRGDEVRTHVPSFTGAGVIVGVVDSGIDIFHDNFLTPGGATRILRIWDQVAPQRIAIAGAANGGTFTLGFTPPGGQEQTTAAIRFDAGPNDVRAALEALDGIDPGDALVTGGPLPGNPITVAFAGRYLKKDVDRMDITDNVAGGVATLTAGREYAPADIAAALAAGPEAPFLHRDNSGHGTHVAGIAAGDGSQADGCKGAGTYVGVAPEAELLIVKTTFDDDDVAAGVEWIFTQAGARRAVVNLSLGSETGPHDGTTTQEQRIDATLAGTTNRAVVVAGGNERNKGIHAFDRINANGTLRWRLVVPDDDKRRDEIDIWYTGATRVRFTLTGPAGVPGVVGPVDPGDPVLNATPAGHRIRVRSILNEPRSGRHNINCIIRPPTGGEVAPGTWTIDLRELAGTAGDVDAWVDFQRTDKFPAFFQDELESDRDSTRMIGPPGAAQNVITVGSYDPRPDEDDPDVYSLAAFSNFGPTSDGRRKPDICAPGVGIMAPKSRARDVSACSDCCIDFYVTKSGTSMAAPHVTGVVALLMQRVPGLRFDQIRDRIQQSGRAPEPNPIPALPNNEWGNGRLDAMRAVFPELPPAAGGGGGGGGPPAPPAPTLLAPAAMVLAEPSLRARIARLQRAVGAGPESQLLAALVSTHFDEVLRLINDNLRVAVAWHRMGGPDLVRTLLTADQPLAALSAAADPQAAEAAGRFLEVLARYGGADLRADVARHGPLVLAVLGTGLSDPRRRAPAA